MAHTAVVSDVAQVAPGVFRIADTVNVYVIKNPDRPEGIAVDFGSGRVLDLLPELGLERLTHVVMTHHHRDQGQRLPRAVAAGIEIHVPPVERELFERVDEMWDSRPAACDYNLRQQQFSLLDAVPVAGEVPEYRIGQWGGIDLEVLPTPGHTIGSVSYLLQRAGQRIAFTGDLVYARGNVWSLAATQWSYTQNEGPVMTVLSSLLLARKRPDLLLPSHGDPIGDPAPALDLLAARMQAYINARRPEDWDIAGCLDHPYAVITPHLLLNRSSFSGSYVLLSETGGALIMDYGYDMINHLPLGTSADRASRRPWLASLGALRREFGVREVEVALPTHYHDDHVAGLNLLRDVEGTQIWIPENVAPVLAEPLRYDLPCLWFDPIVADRVLRLDETVRWHEYTITVHELPGHTRYAVAYEVEVDRVRVLVTGDQQDGLGQRGDRREVLNYQYRNGFQMADFRRSAALYQRVAPGLMISGHSEPRWVDQDYLDLLSRQGEDTLQLHQDLLPLAELDLGADGILARIAPYRSEVPPAGVTVLTVTVRNPHPYAAEVALSLVVPDGWRVDPAQWRRTVAPDQVVSVLFRVQAGRREQRRARCAVDVTLGPLRLGQHAEALVDVRPGVHTGPGTSP